METRIERQVHFSPKLFLPYTLGVVKVGLLEASLEGASTVVNNWGTDMPPDITISASHLNIFNNDVQDCD